MGAEKEGRELEEDGECPICFDGMPIVKGWWPA
jgi:hypothetical protein